MEPKTPTEGAKVAGKSVSRSDQPSKTGPSFDLISKIKSYASAINGTLTSEEDTYEMLLQRDQIASHLSEDDASEYTEVAALVKADRELKSKSEQIVDSLPPTFLSDMRMTRSPKPEAWWWYLDQPGTNPAQVRAGLCLLVAGLFLATALAIGTDIANRFLSVPGKLTIYSTFGPVLLAFAAGTSFVSASRQWLSNFYARARVRYSRQPYVSLVLAMFVCAACLGFKWYLPALSRSYYMSGMDALAAAHDGQERVRNALDDFKLSSALNPGDDLAHYEEGVSYQYLSDFTNASTEYQTCIELNPANTDAYDQLAEVCMLKDKDYNRALSLASAASALPAGDPDTLYATYKNEAWAMWGLQEYDTARDFIDRALELDPESPEANAIKAAIIQDSGNAPKAVPFWNRAAHIAPTALHKYVSPYWSGRAVNALERKK